MPIPSPENNEDKRKFIERCMSSEVMKKDYPDSKQRVAVCYSQTKKKSRGSILVDCAELYAIQAGIALWDDDWNEFTYEEDILDVIDEDGRVVAKDKKAERKRVTLNKPFRTPDGPKKFAVYVKNESGNTVIVRFGDPNMEIKRDDPERKKAFRDRMNCDNPGPKWKANYWSCKMWSSTNVSDLT